MKNKLTFSIVIFLSVALPSTIAFLYFQQYKKQQAEQLDNWLRTIKKHERTIIEKVPTFTDYLTADLTQALRKHLLFDHLNLAKTLDAKNLKNQKEVDQAVSEGKLVKIENLLNKDDFYFYNVGKDGRYLTSATYQRLTNITERFYQNLQKISKELPKVKFAVSSALRTQEYQAKLRQKNLNATLQSSHNYGISFDIFYDSFMVDVDSPQLQLKDIPQKMSRQVGFLLGDALKEQLKTVLSQTLLSMQSEGLIYVILETNQKCFHVSVIR